MITKGGSFYINFVLYNFLSFKQNLVLGTMDTNVRKLQIEKIPLNGQQPRRIAHQSETNTIMVTLLLLYVIPHLS